MIKKYNSENILVCFLGTLFINHYICNVVNNNINLKARKMKNKEFKVRLVNAKHLGEHQLRDGEVPEPESGDPGDSGSGDSGSGDSGSGESTHATGSCSVRGSITRGDITWTANGYLFWSGSIESRNNEVPTDPDAPSNPGDSIEFIVTILSLSCNCNLIGNTVVQYNQSTGVTTTKIGNSLVILQSYTPNVSGESHAEVSITLQDMPLSVAIIETKENEQISSRTEHYNIPISVSFTLSYNPITKQLESSDGSISG